MKKSEQLDKLAGALSKAQSELKGALKDSSNPFFKSKYADIESVWEACREALTKNGLSVAQTCGFDPAVGPTLITTLLHSSGQWLEGEQPLMAKNQSPQDLGSAMTYARRYGLAAIVGVVQVDDDAEGAHGRGNASAKAESSQGKKQSETAPPSASADPSDPGAYVIGFGKHRGKRLDQVGPHDLNSWVNFMREQPELSGKADEAVTAAEAFLLTRDVGRAK